MSKVGGLNAAIDAHYTTHTRKDDEEMRQIYLTRKNKVGGAI